MPDFDINKIRENYKQKKAAIEENLPSWSTVSTVIDNISNLAEAKAVLKKMARIVYWLAKNKKD